MKAGQNERPAHARQEGKNEHGLPSSMRAHMAEPASTGTDIVKDLAHGSTGLSFPARPPRISLKIIENSAHSRAPMPLLA